MVCAFIDDGNDEVAAVAAIDIYICYVIASTFRDIVRKLCSLIKTHFLYVWQAKMHAMQGILAFNRPKKIFPFLSFEAN